MAYYVLMVFLFAGDGELISTFAQEQFDSEKACHGTYYDEVEPLFKNEMKFGRIQNAEKIDHACVRVTSP